MDEIIYDFWVSMLQDGYIGKLVQIVEKAGGAEALYNMKENDLTGYMGLSKRMAKYILSKHIEEGELEEKYEQTYEEGIRYVNYKHMEYPERLKHIEGKPHGIFYKGNLPAEGVPSVAVIGSRECSEYGRMVAEYFGSRLALMGVNIISGMAWGIDGIAQMGCLNFGGSSYAVLGCGPDIVYPKKNRILYDRLCKDGNGVLSEYAPHVMPISKQFPPRNRIISGLSDCVLVVEARARSGTLITVDMAVDQGKTVMVVPGRITDELSIGCLNLISEGAHIAYDVDCVVKELEMTFSEYFLRKRGKSGDIKNRGIREQKIVLNEVEERVYKRLDYSPSEVEIISLQTGITVRELMVILTGLELKGMAREYAPGMYVRCCDFENT